MKRLIFIAMCCLCVSGCETIDHKLLFARVKEPRTAEEKKHFFDVEVKNDLYTFTYAIDSARFDGDKKKVAQAYTESYVKSMSVVEKLYPSFSNSPENMKITSGVMLMRMHDMWSEHYKMMSTPKKYNPNAATNALAKLPEFAGLIPERYKPNGIKEISHNLSDMVHSEAGKTSSKTLSYFYLLMSKYYWPERSHIDDEIKKSRLDITYNFVIHRGKPYYIEGKDVQDYTLPLFDSTTGDRDINLPSEEMLERANNFWDENENRLLSKNDEDEKIITVSDAVEPGARNINITMDILNVSLDGDSISQMESQTVSGTQQRCDKTVIISDKKHSDEGRNHHRHIKRDCYDEPVESTTNYEKITSARSIVMTYKYSANSSNPRFAINKHDSYEWDETSTSTINHDTGEEQMHTGSDFLKDIPVFFALQHVVENIYFATAKKIN